MMSLHEETVVTVGLATVNGRQFRVKFEGDVVSFAAEGIPFGFTVSRQAWQDLCEAGVRAWGRQLHPEADRGTTGVAYFGEVDRILVKDACDNCGAGFGMDGSAMHYPQQLGVCEIVQGPVRGGGQRDG
jgi:hypothetical protein